jgi:hypothetical protein
MFARTLLGIDFPDGMNSGREMAIIDSGRVRVERPQSQRLEQLLQFDKDLIRSTPKHLGQNHPGHMIESMPQPTLVSFALHETPPLIDLCGLNPANLYRNRFGTAPLHDHCVDRREFSGLFFNSPITVLGLTRSTRAISRTPLPLRVISTICRLTSGKRPGYA